MTIVLGIIAAILWVLLTGFAVLGVGWVLYCCYSKRALRR